MNEDIYYQKLGVDDFDSVLEFFTNSIVDTNRSYDFFVDWEKINNYFKEYKVELNIFNSLIGSKDFDDELRNLLVDYPKIIPVIPSLLAIRDLQFPIIRDFFSENIEIINYDFTSRKLSEKEVEEIIYFFHETGLREFFLNISQKSIPDYYLGLEVGMDTNARKNRSGNVMEVFIQNHLDRINKKFNFSFPILSQKNFAELEKSFNINVKSDIANRKADFIFLKDFNKPINIEVNFFSGTGSKPQEIVDAYIERQRELRENNIYFIWITDGFGWKGQQNQIRKGFEKIDYLLNLSFVNKGMLEEIIKSI